MVMVRVLLLQLAALLVVAAACGLGWQAAGFWSAFAGGASYLLPSALSVVLLSFFKKKPEGLRYGFFIGESLKIVLAMVLMLVVFALYHQNLKFIPFILGLIATSHMVFFVFLRVQRYGK